MNWTYLFILIGTLLCPLSLSFDKNVRYYHSWKPSLYAAIIVSIPFIIWDAIFTYLGYWGFNPDFNIGLSIFGLPIEEIFFFIIVPFACTFIYECCKYFLRNYSFKTFNRIFTFSIPAYALVLALMDDVGHYTLAAIVSASIVLFWMMKKPEFKYIPIAFCFTLIPFTVVNGILTGGVTDAPVVWYNELQKVDARIFTIPMEDVLYNFALLASNMLLFEKIKQKTSQ